MGQLHAAVQALCVGMVMDHEPTTMTNPLLWWMAVLVHSLLMPLKQGMDYYISRGKFYRNILPMDIDVRTPYRGPPTLRESPHTGPHLQHMGDEPSRTAGGPTGAQYGEQ
jgi:hypothetical protein